MKGIKQKHGYEIKVGDFVVAKHAFGQNVYPITRTTQKYALSKISDTYMAKFPIVYGFGFSLLPYRSHRVDYEVYVPVQENK